MTPDTEDPQVKQTAEALINLVTATQHDCKMLADLTAMNKGLVNQLKAKEKEIRDLRNQLKQAKKNQSAPAQATTPTPPLKAIRYCWTHGFNPWGKDHYSDNCKSPMTGHCAKATSTNTMGGSQRGKPRA